MVTVDNVGTKLYTYTSPIGKVFLTNGLQIITAYAVLSPDDTPPCFEGSDLEFNFEIEVVPLGNAHFDVPEICAGAQTKFTDNSNITGNSIAQWRWDFDGTKYTDKDPIHVFTRGTHTVKLSVANAAGCWSDEYSQTFNVIKDFPKLEFNALKPVCFKDAPMQFVVAEKMGLTAAPVLTGFKGKGVTKSGIFTPAVAGVGIHKITYVFSSVEGCVDSIAQDIEVYATTLIDVPRTVYILTGGQKVIPANITTPNETYNYKYKWTPSIGLSDDSIINPIASPEKDTEYTLTVSLDGYCDVSQQVLVKVLDQLSPPNSFSPNGDGINDVWNIASLDSYPSSVITVFNRSGQQVFISKGYDVPFDGTYLKKPLPVGVYYYRISPNNGRKTISGALTIIR